MLLYYTIQQYGHGNVNRITYTVITAKTFIRLEKKGQSRETNNIKDTRRKEAKQKTHHNMCWTPLCTNKHKSHGTQKVKTHNRTTAKKDEQHGPHKTTRGHGNVNRITYTVITAKTFIRLDSIYE
jgi:hypothetical protein